MSSILTNTSAMIALQTLRGINTNLESTQSQISTGKAVATAKDNSSVWAISKVMESDVSGFTAISESLSLGESTVAVARQAAETVTDLLTQMKEKIVAAQENNIDRAKVQSDVAALRDQIASVVGAAQFNGLNLVDGSVASTDVLSSLDRDASGNVTSSSITVNAQDLSTGGYAAKDVLTGSTGASTNADSAAFTIDTGGATGNIVTNESSDTFAAGDRIILSVEDQTVAYTVTAEDAAATTTGDIVALGLKSAVDALGISDATGALDIDYNSGTPGTLVFTNNTGEDIAISAQFENAGSGGLGLLAGIDVSSQVGAANALGNIESLIQTAVDASAAFGTAETRIDIQSSFVSKLTDSMTAGIGSLVDADMEEASARLQALQVQQQLGTQALSIANQSPQNILSLFR